jgi:hypothetical protein
MVRVVETLGRVAAVAAGAGAAYWIAQSTDGETVAWVAGIAVLIVAGAVANRTWAAWLPLAAFVPWLLVFLAVGDKQDARDFTWEFGVVLVAATLACVSLLLHAGVALRRLLYSVFSPQKDALKFPL